VHLFKSRLDSVELIITESLEFELDRDLAHNTSLSLESSSITFSSVSLVRLSVSSWQLRKQMDGAVQFSEFTSH
jgi:hypothetical protein